MKRFFARERPVVAPEGCLRRPSITRRCRGRDRHLRRDRPSAPGRPCTWQLARRTSPSPPGSSEPWPSRRGRLRKKDMRDGRFPRSGLASMLFDETVEQLRLLQPGCCVTSSGTGLPKPQHEFLDFAGTCVSEASFSGDKRPIQYVTSRSPGSPHDPIVPATSPSTTMTRLITLSSALSLAPLLLARGSPSWLRKRASPANPKAHMTKGGR
jgi:hypothetical protein